MLEYFQKTFFDLTTSNTFNSRIYFFFQMFYLFNSIFLHIRLSSFITLFCFSLTSSTVLFHFLFHSLQLLIRGCIFMIVFKEKNVLLQHQITFIHKMQHTKYILESREFFLFAFFFFLSLSLEHFFFSPRK